MAVCRNKAWELWQPQWVAGCEAGCLSWHPYFTKAGSVLSSSSSTASNPATRHASTFSFLLIRLQIHPLHLHLQIHYVEIDIEQDPEMAEAAGVNGTPTVQFFKAKDMVQSMPGVRMKRDYKSVIDQYVN